jgi:type I restriction enzyme S subunit
LNTGFPYIKAGDLKKGTVLLDQIEYLTKEVHEKIKNYKVEDGDVYITIVGASIGDVGIIPRQMHGANLTENAAKIFKLKKLLNYYLVCFLNSDKGIKQINYSIGTGAQPKLGLNKIEAIQIPLPPLPEQRRIAAILSTWDRAIELTQQLIAAKTQQKRALMQQLLTGRVRVPGCSGTWQEVKLNYFFEEINLKTENNDEFKVLTSSRRGLFPQKEYYGTNRITERDSVGFNILPNKCFTYRSRSDDGIFKFNRNDLGYTGCISKYYPVFKIKNGDSDFFLNFLEFNSYNFRKYAVGTSQLVLSFKDLGRVKFFLPDSKEQRLIGNILSKADAELALLERRLAALQEQKRGLMQVLLTGKIRVKVEEKENPG